MVVDEDWVGDGVELGNASRTWVASRGRRAMNLVSVHRSLHLHEVLY